MQIRPGASRLFILIIPTALLSIVLAGCGALSATPISWSLTPSAAAATSSAAPTSLVSTQPPTPAPTVAPIRTATDTPDPAAPVYPGPWVVTLRNDNRAIVALHPDGTGKQEIESPDPVLYPSDLSQGASPASPYLAIRTGQPDLARLSLALVSLSDGKIELLAPLLSDAIQQKLRERKPDESMPEPVTAVTLPDSMRWSPDGRYLAFIGAGDGPSADLYLYDIRTRKTRRLTGGLSQAISPTWSPDSLWVLTQEVASFNATSGWRLTRVWAAAVDHNEMRSLYVPPANSIRERIMAWIGNSSLALFTQAPDSARDAREIPISARRIDRIYGGPAVEMAFDPATRTLAFTEDALTGPQLGLAPGLYWMAGQNQVPQLAQAGEWQDLEWSSAAGRFFASGSLGMLSLKPGGETYLYKGETHADAAPSGLWLVGWGGEGDLQPGLRLYQPNSQPLQVVTSQPVRQVIWQPDSKAFWFQAGDQLYRAAFPDAQPVLIEQKLVENSLGWVGTRTNP